METASRTIKSGSYTLALGLIALGAGLLGANVGILQVPAVLRLWPLLLIGLGLEYFIRKLAARGNEVQFSLPSTVVIILLAGALAAANALSGLIPGKLMEEGFWWGQRSEYQRQWQGDPVSLEKGAFLEVENKLGEVEIIPSPDDRLHLSARITGKGPNPGAARAAAENMRVVVESGKITRVYTDQDRNTLARLRLEIPKGLKVKVSDDMGSITARGISAESLELKTSMGRVEAEGVTGSIDAASRMGEVSLKEISGDITAETSMGRVNIVNPAGVVSAVSKNGSVSLSSDRPLNGKYSLRSDLGQVTLRLPRSSDLRIQAVTEHGGISGLEGNRTNQSGGSRGDLTLGGGAGLANLETKNGSVRVDITG